MLKEIRFKNWKSFKDATLYIDPLTVLIGTNASGKSNAIDGLEFIQKAIQGLSFDSILQEIRGGIEWAAMKPYSEFSIEAVVSDEDEKVDYVYHFQVNTATYAYLMKESLAEINTKNNKQKILYSAAESAGDLNVHFAEGDMIPFGSRGLLLLPIIRHSTKSNEPHLKKAINTVYDALGRIRIFDPIPSRMRDYSASSTDLLRDASNLAGVLTALPLHEKNQVEQTLSNYVAQLPENEIRKVWAEPVGRLKKDSMLYCEEGWIEGQEPLLMDASGMSDGTLRFLGILTALLTSPSGSLMVVEEVDNGLHPSRAGLLIQMLRDIGAQRQIDVLVTTHNPALLDALGPEMVPFIIVAHRSPDTGESKLTLLEEIHNLPKLLASGPLGKIVTQGAVEKSLHEGEGNPS